jgi:hypothetical protein
MDPVRRVWTIRGQRDNIRDACKVAAFIRDNGLRVRVTVVRRPDPIPVKPAISSQSKDWRDNQASNVIELADARKRYKSPG